MQKSEVKGLQIMIRCNSRWIDVPNAGIEIWHLHINEIDGTCGHASIETRSESYVRRITLVEWLCVTCVLHHAWVGCSWRGTFSSDANIELLHMELAADPQAYIESRRRLTVSKATVPTTPN